MKEYIYGLSILVAWVIITAVLITMLVRTAPHDCQKNNKEQIEWNTKQMLHNNQHINDFHTERD
jgi:hypothetical protein